MINLTNYTITTPRQLDLSRNITVIDGIQYSNSIIMDRIFTVSFFLFVIFIFYSLKKNKTELFENLLKYILINLISFILFLSLKIKIDNINVLNFESIILLLSIFPFMLGFLGISAKYGTRVWELYDQEKKKRELLLISDKK